MRGTALRRLIAAAYIVLVIAAALANVWVMKYTLAIHRLRRGVGDTVFLSADGKPWFRMDERRRDVPIDDIARDLRDAVLAIEDHRFYSHFGIDPIGVSRAAMRNVTRDNLEGGSTVTQQLARTMFLSNRRTWGRKVQEAGLALLLELQLSKEQILELYLNRIYLSGGMYGVEATSQAVFGKPAKQLNLAEAALIAGLIKAPSALSPWGNLEEARERSFVVLARMRELGVITDEEERRARATRLRIRPFPQFAERHGYAKDYLRQLFRERFGGDHPPDWKVHTTFVPELQDAAERAVSAGVRRWGIPDLQAALVAMDPRSGDILAIVGGADYSTSTFNRAVRSERQPGSAFKPFVYAAALERGWSPVSMLEGLSSMEPLGPEEWQPRNATYSSPDRISLRQALFESNNRAASALQRRIGSNAVLSMAGSAGLRDQPDVPSLALGSGEVTPLDLTAAYAPFANGGEAVTPRGILRVEDAGGDVVVRTSPERRRIMSQETAFQMFTMLQDVIDRGTAAGARGLGVRFTAAGKTGTTNEYKDAWFVGFSSSLVVGVWVGLDKPATIAGDGSGARMAMPIWADFMRRAVRYRLPRPISPPASMRQVPLCRESFLRPMEQCPRYIEYFKEGDDVPGAQCPIHTGTWEERTERAVEGFFRGLGRRLRGIFRFDR